MTNGNPNLTFLSTKVIQKEYFPMFSIKTVRNIIRKNVPISRVGNKMLVRQSVIERYLTSLKDSSQE